MIENDGPVSTVTINRPERRNAVDAETAALLAEAFVSFEADERRSVAILTGAGAAFCAGYDLHSVSEGALAYDPEAGGPMGPTRMLLTKPVIAAVEGHAVAGGLELALWCDLRIASATAIFGVFCRRWGVPLIDGGNIRLPRLIGHGRAMDMILTGRPVNADEALQFGLVNQVVEAGGALAAAKDLAVRIADFPQTCMRTDRMTAHRQWGMPLEEALHIEAVEGAKPLADEAVKGATRFSRGAGRSGNFDD
nr:crotonase/enoyl-CoA hydratase family protein [Flavimaribacter sediminis]